MRNRIPLLFLTSLALLAPGAGRAAPTDFTFTVDVGTHLADADTTDNACADTNGQCSLRAAIEQINAFADGPQTLHRINVNVATVTLDGAGLPPINFPTVVDGAGGGPRARIDGNNSTCFQLDSPESGGAVPGFLGFPNFNNSRLENLVINNCSGNGVSINGHGYVVSNSYIGVDTAGEAAVANSGSGIDVTSPAGENSIPTELIGGLLPGDLQDEFDVVEYIIATLPNIAPNAIINNVISGNALHGIDISGEFTSGTIVFSNKIGTDDDATSKIPNGTAGGDQYGVRITGSAYANIIGLGNVIAGNDADPVSGGVMISTGPVPFPNIVAGNLVGTSGVGFLDLGNSQFGIRTAGVRPTDATDAMNDPETIDNPLDLAVVIGPGNIVGYNGNTDPASISFVDTAFGDAGISVFDANDDGVLITGNIVGISDGILNAIDIGNQGDGIHVVGKNVTIGGDTLPLGNIVGSNDRHGIVLGGGANAAGNVTRANAIGTLPDFLVDAPLLGNAGHGIWVRSGGQEIGGDSFDNHRNVIANNGLDGIDFADVSSHFGNNIRKNSIYGVASGHLGIDLKATGGEDVPDPTNNASIPDRSDFSESYANWQQNTVTLSNPGSSGGNTTASWELRSALNGQYTIEFYRTDANERGGREFLCEITGVVTAGADGDSAEGGVAVGSMCAGGNLAGQFVTATVTDTQPTQPDEPDRPGFAGMSVPVLNTSEFSAPLAIPDEVRFTLATQPDAAESAGTVQVAVERFGSGAGMASVEVVVTGGSATGGAGNDYVLGTAMVSWNDTETGTRTVDVTIDDDGLDEANETIQFGLQNVSGALIGSPSASSLTILDDDAPPTIGVADAGVLETEASQPLTFTATLSAASSFDVVVTYDTADGSATAPADYTAAVDQMVTIPAGMMQATFDVTVTGDLLNEADETFLVDISATNTTVAGSDLQATGTIQNDDPLPNVGMADVGPQDEGDGPAATPFTFTLALDAASGRDVAVRVTSSDGTAVAPGDYAAVDQVFTIPAGMMSVPVTVNVVGDTTFEPAATETFTLGLAADAIQTLFANISDPSATGTITNDDGSPGTLQFTPANPDQSVAEGGMATFTVSRTGGSAGEVSTTIALGGDATLTTDYTTGGLTLTWMDGDATDKTVTVDVVDDPDTEAAETVTLTLGAPTGGASLGAPSLATLTIQASDAMAGTLQFTPANPDQSVAEGGMATFTVSRTGGSSGEVSTTLALGGSATLTTDYTTGGLTLTWMDGDATDKTVTVNVVDDPDAEAAETVTLTLGAPTGGASLGAPSLATLTIQASDPMPGTLQFTPANPDQSVAEGGMATFTVSRTGGSAGEVSTTIALGGDATLTTDYTTGGLTLTWMDGDATDKTVTVSVVDDPDTEAAETVTLTLGAPSGGATLGAPGAATLTIQASDALAGTLQFTPANPDQSVAEGGMATFTVSRTGGSAGEVSTTIALGGDATLTTDYTTGGLTLTWMDGDATDRTVTVNVVDDPDAEAAETVTLTLGAPTGGASLGVPSLATLTIQASDAMAGTLQFTPANPDQSVAEGGMATFTVSRTGGSSGEVSTTLALGGSATPITDYTTTGLTLTWMDGDAANKTITLTVVDDPDTEAAETATLTLGAPTGGAALAAPQAATLTILASDAMAGTLQFTPVAPDQSVAEGGMATFTVSRTGGSAGEVSTTLVLGGTATLASDYGTTGLTLTWMDGDVANKTIAVTTVDDPDSEGAETVTLTLGAPSGGATLGTPQAATLTIQASDAMAGSLQFTPAAPDQSVAEGGMATFTVSRTGGSSGPVGATITLGGSAALGSDYTTGALTLSWADGDTANKTITVTTIDDTSSEGAETVALTLGAPTGGAVIGAPALATLTIQASDASPGSLQFASGLPNQTVGEAAGVVTYTFSRTGGSSGPVSITVTLAGTASSPADYTTSSTTLTWADGDSTPKTLNFTLVDDAAVEGNETVTLTLGNATGGAVVGAPGAASLTIVDNDGAVIGTGPRIVPATSPWALALLVLAMGGLMWRRRAVPVRR